MASIDEAFGAFYAALDVIETISAYENLLEATSTNSLSREGIFSLLDQISKCKLPGGRDLSLHLREKLHAPLSHCADTKVLVVGAGPGGIRAAIEARALGADVELVEKRNYFSRSNVLKLWPGTVEDCLSLGLKVFYRKFGSRENEKVSIKRLQVSLLKVALLIGVKVRVGLTFRRVYPPVGSGKYWTVGFHKKGSQNEKVKIECDVCVGADGENSRVASAVNIQSSEIQFSKALGITFNFVSTNTTREVRVLEFTKSGFLHKQFFDEIHRVTKVRLENMIYFQEETHYFVMAARPNTLVDAGILREAQSTMADPTKYLSSANVDKAQLQTFARQITNLIELPADLPFALDYRGKPDMGVFDFTKKRACHASCKVLDSNGKRLLVNLVGDAVVAPFWPLGTGANKAILGAFDSGYAVEQYSRLRTKNATDEQLGAMLTEQLHVFTLLKSCDPTSLRNNQHGSYSTVRKFSWTMDPQTRYIGYQRARADLPQDNVTKIEFDNYTVNDSPNNTVPPATPSKKKPGARKKPTTDENIRRIKTFTSYQDFSNLVPPTSNIQPSTTPPPTTRTPSTAAPSKKTTPTTRKTASSNPIPPAATPQPAVIQRRSVKRIGKMYDGFAADNQRNNKFGKPLPPVPEATRSRKISVAIPQAIARFLRSNPEVQTLDQLSKKLSS